MRSETNVPETNVVARLKDRLRHARGMGFHVRMELLDGEQATWCEIAGIPTLFVDLSQTAAEQLQQVDEALVAYAQQHPDFDSQALEANSCSPAGPATAKRVA